MNIVVTYTAGYLVPLEPQTIPAPISPATVSIVAVDQTQGPWSADNGVVGADGTIFELVKGTPGPGQYAIGTIAGTYIFDGTDQGTDILVSYSYTPRDISQAATEWVAERFSYKNRIGQRHKSLGGQETITYDLSGIPDYIAVALQPYRSVIQIL